jgi:predicted O-linked N-acetylglucosamine transferase (SPINDLY family)
MSAMDYRLTDDQADPPGVTDPFYSERLIRLPRSFFCYRPTDDSPPITPLPARCAGYVTFGSFNHIKKASPETLLAWMQLLARVPRSRLIVLADRGGSVEQRLRGLAHAAGVDPTRIELHAKRSRHDYLRLQQEADIALDCFPFNGHTTTCDSLWMGVPVVMLRGQAYASRFGGSVLMNVGLEHLIAESVTGYIDRAAALAEDLDRLDALRGDLRRRMADSALLDHRGFTRSLEQAYRQMWHAWCGL